VNSINRIPFFLHLVLSSTLGKPYYELLTILYLSTVVLVQPSNICPIIHFISSLYVTCPVYHIRPF
jgi:hypothetical protein